MRVIDLNCDMGEGCGNDAALMDYVSSVNIACGAHAGDTQTMRKTVETAVSKGIAIGAHPGYPDRENFGRIPMNLTHTDIHNLMVDQVAALKDVCDEFAADLRHVKPHGALYNQSARDPELARVIANAVLSISKDLILFGLSGSQSIDEAKQLGLRTASEVFADRTYMPDGSLTPRTDANAMITDARVAATQVLQMITKRTVTATGDVEVPITADTVCIHGDGQNALAFAATIHRELTDNGIAIKAL